MNDHRFNSGRTMDADYTHEAATHLHEAEQSVALARSKGLLRRLLPTATDREIAAHEGELLRAGFEYRRRVVQMAVEVRMQAIEEACNHALVTGKASIRRERQEFFGQELLRLRRRMDEYAELFNREVDGRLSALGQYRNEHLRRNEEERLLRSVEQFHALLDRLAEEFVAIINEGVSR